ncbi:MAG: 16S rRNA (guanine(527)-N(7))-methyltransferase RsmG [Planctomycetaceae bacterium]|jgi:16S rRNA (guanine527-N7)-methyltransferase|nr:16S rRNA (guanine(527)-N(7))-methyltransferase RsmG [Planctomycetaceae bacterium]
MNSTNRTPATHSLAESLKRFNITISKSQTRRLDEYCCLLWDWNTRFNLTRHTDYDKFVARDLVDSMSLADFLRPDERVLDIGSGGGVPGIVLAVLRPDLQIELCDATGKKALALSEMVRELRLNIPVHHNKAETILAARAKGTRFTTLTIRAVSRLVQLLRMVGPYWNVFDRLLLVKGPKWVEERGEARHYNLMTKLALRCLKTYPTPTSHPLAETINEEETINEKIMNEGIINSVILQLCRKDDFEQLDKIIDAHKIEEPEPPHEFRRRFPSKNKKRS